MGGGWWGELVCGESTNQMELIAFELLAYKVH